MSGLGVTLHSYTNEGILLQQLKNLFPQEPAYVNVRSGHQLSYPSTQSSMEFDVWMPSLNLAFEFQDSYHYITTWYNQFPQDHINQKDRMKHILARQQGLSLVVVPCWWNGELEMLQATIYFQRPDLSLPSLPRFAPSHSPRSQLASDPIPMNPSTQFLMNPVIPGVGELMLASFPVDPSFKDIVPANIWWMGEKYDGIRCCWNSRIHKLYSRNGRQLHLDSKFTNTLPNFFMDGELWFGRGQFYFSYMLINQSPGDTYIWSFFRMVSFDVPSQAHQQLPFERRYTLLLHHSQYDHVFNIVVARLLCNGKSNLTVGLKNIIKNGGEGVIMRLRGSTYESGRNQSLIKLKGAVADREAVVIGTSAKEVILKLPNGTTFIVPLQNVDIPTPDIGEVVSFFYESNARRDKPVNPRVYRVRTDVSWEEVVHNFYEEDRSEASDTPAFVSKPIGYWSNRNMRAFLEDFARRRNMDPLLPQTWYNISSQDIAQTKEGKVVLRKFKGYTQTIEVLFPDIKIDRRSIKTATWGNIENRRLFFEQFAKENDFDHQNSEAWYSQSRSKILASKGALGVVSHHKNSVTQALLDLFPNIGLEKSKFSNISSTTQPSPSAKRLQKILQSKTPSQDVSLQQRIAKKDQPVPPGHWQDAGNRRKYMEWLATQLGYHHWEDWYQIDSNAFQQRRGAGLLFHCFHNSPSTAVVATFPEHKWDRFKFRVVPHGYWDVAHNQREYMEWLGETLEFKTFDDWYKVDNVSFLAHHGAGFLKKYGNSPRAAVTAVWSEHQWVSAKFVGKIDFMYRPTSKKLKHS